MVNTICAVCPLASHNLLTKTSSELWTGPSPSQGVHTSFLKSSTTDDGDPSISPAFSSLEERPRWVLKTGSKHASRQARTWPHKQGAQVHGRGVVLSLQEQIFLNHSNVQHSLAWLLILRDIDLLPLRTQTLGTHKQGTFDIFSFHELTPCHCPLYMSANPAGPSAHLHLVLHHPPRLDSGPPVQARPKVTQMQP